MSIHAQANNYQVKANFWNGIRNKKLWLILLLVNLFAVPYAIINIGFFGGDSFFSLALTGFAMVVNMLLAIVIPFTQFDYCYDKTRVDMAYALPLTRKQKFLSDFFSGLTMYVGGYLVQIVLSYVATGVFLRFGSKNSLFNSYFNYRLEAIGNQWLWSRVTKILVIVLLIQLLLYVVTSFVLSCTGAIFEAVSATIYFNILIPTTIYVTYLLCVSKLFGMDFSEGFLKAAFRTSPLGGFIYLITVVSNDEKFISWLIPYCIVILLFFVATYFIMTKRKAESVGKPFVVRPFYHIILAAVMLHIGVLACYTSNSIVSFLLMTSVFYLVIEIITNRGLKASFKSLRRYAILIAGVLVVIITINKTNCFGIAYHVADANDVDKITISYGGLYSDFYTNNVEITSKEGIERLLEVQKKLIDEYKENSKKEEKTGSLNFDLLNTYEWNSVLSGSLRMQVSGNGRANYYRSYVVPYSYMVELLDVELSDEYIQGKIKAYKNSATYLTVSDVYGVNQKVVVNDTNGQPSVVMKEFFDALQEDLMNTTKEEYLQPQNTIKYRVWTDEGFIYILDSYTNVIAFLEKYSAMPALAQEDYKNIVENYTIQIHPTLNPADDTKDYSGDYYAGYYNDYYDDYDGYYTTACSVYFSYDSRYMIRDFNEDVEQLLQVAQAQYASDTPCYKIEVNGTMYVIPTEYTELVESIIANNSVSVDEYYSEKY